MLISDIKVAIVVARFNLPVTEKLLEGAQAQLQERGILLENIQVKWVPGAVELPLIAQQYARAGMVNVIICLGAVIRGETDHYDYVCQQVSQGCQQVALQHNIPVIFGVLTTRNAEQAFARVGGAKGHLGREYADTAIEMVQLMCTSASTRVLPESMA